MPVLQCPDVSTAKDQKGHKGKKTADNWVANSSGIPAGILEFRSDSMILPPELHNKFLYVPDFSGVLSLCHSREPAIL
jgi:hypothetical protein